MVKEFVLFLVRPLFSPPVVSSTDSLSSSRQGLTVLTASGFLVTFRVLSHGTWTVGHISWLMLRMHLGSAFLGFEAAQQVRFLRFFPRHLS
jgi:hypothetical protein